VHADCYDKEAHTKRELKKHTEDQKTTAIHRSIVSVPHINGKKKSCQKFAMLGVLDTVAAFIAHALHCCTEAPVSDRLLSCAPNSLTKVENS
jgi:hypothetical protein